MKKREEIPTYNSEEEEREFWASHDSVDYIDWKSSEKTIFPNLKPSSKTISLRVPEYILEELKMLAKKRDVPYQSLIKMYLKDRIDKELNHIA